MCLVNNNQKLFACSRNLLKMVQRGFYLSGTEHRRVEAKLVFINLPLSDKMRRRNNYCAQPQITCYRRCNYRFTKSHNVRDNGSIMVFNCIKSKLHCISLVFEIIVSAFSYVVRCKDIVFGWNVEIFMKNSDIHQIRCI